MEKKKCKQCEWDWMPRVEDPVECPKCKRRDWKGESKNNKIQKEVEQK